METSTIEIRHRKTTKGENYKTPSYLRNAVKKYEEQNITPEKRQAKLAYLNAYYKRKKEEKQILSENQTETKETHNNTIILKKMSLIKHLNILDKL